MKGKKQVEIYLQGLSKAPKNINSLEQYPTDASVASYILSLAFEDGNIKGKSILDLGTGNGIFACGALVLGAKSVLGIDIDPEQVRVAIENCSQDNAEFMVGDVSSVNGRFDTVLMNSPFGSVKEHADIPFLKKAVQSAEHIYSLHNAKSRDFVRAFYSVNGEILRDQLVDIRVGRLYGHHKKDMSTIKAVFFYVKTRQKSPESRNNN